MHLRTEIQRLKKAGKEGQKGKKGRCVNNEYKSSNHLDLNNVEKYGTCSVCKSLEHYRCASVDSHLKSTYQDGSQLYLCKGSHLRP